jgi:hypothetical protein
MSVLNPRYEANWLYDVLVSLAAALVLVRLTALLGVSLSADLDSLAIATG